jgi:tryptophanyl-tRNA synthetase
MWLTFGALTMVMFALNSSCLPVNCFKLARVVRHSLCRPLSVTSSDSVIAGLQPLVANARKRVLSGIQPTGLLHIGNYLGALRQWVKYQDMYDNYFCVVDLHAITLPHDPARLASDTRQAAAMYLACGIDPTKSKIFVQSHVAAHAQFTWLLNCITPMSWLERMIQYKEKSTKQGENVNVGLFDYPVLMAADILLYGAHLVPVGEDQQQHLELARDLAKRFNHQFGRRSNTSDKGSGNNTSTGGDVSNSLSSSGTQKFRHSLLREPQALIQKEGARVMSLQDGLSKMSKSAESDFSRINLLDPPELIAQKIRKCKTDSFTAEAGIEWDNPARPEAANLLNIYQAVSGRSAEEVRADVAGVQWGGFKQLLTEAVVQHLSPIQARYREIAADPAYVDGVLRDGRLAATAEAEKTLRAVENAMGFLPLTR